MRLIDTATEIGAPLPGSIYWLCEGIAEASPDEWLAPAELAHFAALRAAKRRHDWLAGRIVAKRLLGRLLAALDYPLEPPHIVILPHPDGWPQVSLPALGRAAPPLTLSISHTRDSAFCAVTLGDAEALGCDLEFVEPRSPGFVADYFTAAERDLMAAAPPDGHALLANAIWSGKEGALKAIRRGLAEDTRLVTCLPAMAGERDGWRPLAYSWTAADRALPALSGWWREADGFVMTLAATA